MRSAPIVCATASVRVVWSVDTSRKYDDNSLTDSLLQRSHVTAIVDVHKKVIQSNSMLMLRTGAWNHS